MSGMRGSRAWAISGLLAIGSCLAAAASGDEPATGGGLVVGSKAFPESWILAEALAILAREEGASRSSTGEISAAPRSSTPRCAPAPPTPIPSTPARSPR